MNDFICVGKVIEKPELQKTNTGIDFCNLIVASDKPFPNTDGKFEKEDFSITCWKNVAEDVMKKIKEGMSVEIKGRISANNYRSNDDKFYFKTDLIAERVSALE